jgi:SNF2 family DNA or RNA helicase
MDSYGNKRLLSHQIVGRDFLKANPRAGLFDDMGLGKTIQVLAAAKDLGIGVTVIGPPGLKLDWQAEAKNVSVDLVYHSYAKLPETVNPYDALVVEEAQWTQGGRKTARGRKILDLVKATRPDYVWCLTGTPMRNSRPVNLSTILELIGIIPNDIDYWDYLNTYCGPRSMAVGSKIVTVYDGATDLKGLANLIKDKTLRRLKTEVLDLPDKVYCDRRVPINKPALIKKKLEEYKQQLAANMKANGTEDHLPVAEKLQALNRLKLVSELDKVPYVLELAADLDESTIYFCCYLEAARSLGQGLVCPVIDGSTDSQTKSRIIGDFQAGSMKSLVLTIRSSGTGITLTKAQNVVFVGQEWAPDDNAQAEDRAYRIGQDNRLTIFKLENALDWHLKRVHSTKNQNAKEFMASIAGVKSML